MTPSSRRALDWDTRVRLLAEGAVEEIDHGEEHAHWVVEGSPGGVPWLPDGSAATDPPGEARAPDAPLTVAGAAKRERVSERTIRRWLPALAADGGAWQVGTHWRIDPAALDRRRAESRRPRARKAPTRARARSTPREDAMGWPDA